MFGSNATWSPKYKKWVTPGDLTVPPLPSLLSNANEAAAQNPLMTLPSTILSGAEFDYVAQQNAKRKRAVDAGVATDDKAFADEENMGTDETPTGSVWRMVAASIVGSRTK